MLTEPMDAFKQSTSFLGTQWTRNWIGGQRYNEGVCVWGACFFFYSRHISLGTPFQYFTEHEPRRHGMVIAITVARARPPHTGKHCVSAMCQAPYKPYHLLLFHLFSPMRYYSFLFACELTEAQSP